MENNKKVSRKDESEYAESNVKTIIIVGVTLLMLASIVFAFLRM